MSMHDAIEKHAPKNQVTEKPSSIWAHEELAQVKIKVLRGHTDAVKSCQYCDKDTKVLTASHDETVILWDIETGDKLKVYADGHQGNITQAFASPDLTRFVSCGWDKTLNVWNTESGEILWSGHHGGIVTCCCFSHDGQLVVSGSDLDHTVKLWDANTGECLQVMSDLHSSTITSCMFSPGDDRVITTSMDRSTRFWDVKAQSNTITLKGHINVISDASLTEDERKLATVSYDKSIMVWDVSTGMYRSHGPSTTEKAHEGCISACDFSKDGLLLVTGGFDNTVCMWDVEHKVQKLRLQGHEDWVEDVAFSSDQKWLLTCSKDHTVRLWNVEDTDNIPMVIEKQKAVGLHVFKCVKCGKPFSVAQIDSHSDIKICVFCRLQAPSTNIPSIE